MKSTSQGTVHRITKAGACLFRIFVCYTLASCNSDLPTQPSRPVATQSANWYLAKTNPPTYFPKGVPTDHPTTCNDGNWVIIGDAVDTRYFIPARGVDNLLLTSDALNRVTPNQRRNLKKTGNKSDSLLEAVGIGLGEFGAVIMNIDPQAAAMHHQQKSMKTRGVSGICENKPRR